MFSPKVSTTIFSPMLVNGTPSSSKEISDSVPVSLSLTSSPLSLIPNTVISSMISSPIAIVFSRSEQVTPRNWFTVLSSYLKIVPSWVINSLLSLKPIVVSTVIVVSPCFHALCALVLPGMVNSFLSFLISSLETNK